MVMEAQRIVVVPLSFIAPQQMPAQLKLSKAIESNMAFHNSRMYLEEKCDAHSSAMQ